MPPLPQCIHIGLAKTGTTTLQKILFARHSEIVYLGKVWSQDESLLATMGDVSRKPTHRLSADWLETVAAPQVQRAITENSTGRKLVMFSEEDLTSYRFIEPAVAAARMKAILPYAKILVVLRDPLEWLQSMYFFRLSLRFPETLDGFENWFIENNKKPTLGTDLGQLKINETLDEYSKLFGENNIHILFYEDMRNDVENFITKLSDFLGINSAEAVNLYTAGGNSRFEKSRVTQAAHDFLLSFRLVRDGAYAEYLETLRPMIERLPANVRIRAEALIPTDLGLPPEELTQKFRTLSAFLDRAPGALAENHGRAAAMVSDTTMHLVMDAVAPGLRAITKRFGVPADRYLNELQAKTA